MHSDKLQKLIEEGVSKGIPIDYISYSLEKAGWPTGMIKEEINKWLVKNGRFQKSTNFKIWIKKYYKQAFFGIFIMTLLNVFDDGIALLKPVPLKILADSVFNTIPAPGLLRQYTGKPIFSPGIIVILI